MDAIAGMVSSRPTSATAGFGPREELADVTTGVRRFLAIISTQIGRPF